MWIHWFRDLHATIHNGSVTTGWTSLIGVGHWGSDSIMPLMLHTVCCTIAGALALYYRSLGTTSTPLRRDNISGRPCIGVMTYNALVFLHQNNYVFIADSILQTLKTLKHIKWCISGGNAFFLVTTRNARLLLLSGLMSYQIAKFTY
jgi:hypothetical protein